MKYPSLFASLLLISTSSVGAATAIHLTSTTIVADSGMVVRRDIPNDFLDVSLPGGDVSIVGTSDADVHWVTTTPHSVTTVTAASRVSLSVSENSMTHADLVLRVPESLRLIHLKVHGEGSVKLSGLSGEVNVEIDSGFIAGHDLQGTLTLEARHGDVRLNLVSRAAQGRHVTVLAQQGTIELTMNAQPSVAFDLATVCGQVTSEFALTREIPAMRVPSPAAGIRGAAPLIDCRRGNSWSPPVPGAPMQVTVQSKLGDGATTLSARAIQGDILVKSAATSVAAVPQQGHSLAITRDLRIDGNAADLSRVSTMLVTRDGGIIIGQPQDMHLKYFTSNGKFVGTFGQKGGGPGEFQNIDRVGWTGDSLWVYDRNTERMTVISPDRKLVRNVALPAGAFGTDKVRGFEFYYTPWGMMPDGSVVLHGSALPASAANRNPPKPWMALAIPPVVGYPDFHAVAVIGKPGVSNCGFENECPRIEPTLNAVDIRFVDAEPATHEVKNGSYLYRITAHDATGKTLWVKTMPIAGPPLTKHEADSNRAELLSALKTRQGSMTADGYASAALEIRRYQYPAIKVPVTLIYTGRDGSTWIRLRGDPRPWIVLDKNGNLYGRIATPANLSVYAVSLDALWGIEPAADGSDDIVRYAVKVTGGNR